MSTLNDFMDEERERLVSMPVQVGYWIAAADDIAGSGRDDRKEEIALERALEMIVAKTDDARFVNDVCEFALCSRADWPRWAEGAEQVLDRLPALFQLIEGRLTAKDLKDYKSMIYRVAGIVAQAANEAGGSRDGREGGLFGKFWDRVSVKTDMSMPENVSRAEKAALQKLLVCLKG